MGFLSSGSTFASAVQTLIGVLNMIVGVLVALAMVVFFIGLVRYIRAAGDSKGHAEGRERIIWSIIALFVLFSVWGLINLMSVTFFGTSNPSQGSAYNASIVGGSSFNGTGY